MTVIDAILLAIGLRRARPPIFRRRTCYWCPARAECSSGYIDCCAVCHVTQHKPFVVCKTIGD